MTLSKVLGALARRWYATALGLAVTAGLVFVAFSAVPAEYEGKAGVLLVPPIPRGNPGGANPYLGLSGYEAFADIVSRAMNDTFTVVRLRNEGVVDPFVIERDLTTNGPVVSVTVTGALRDRVRREISTIVATVPSVTATLQSGQGVAAKDRFTATVITHPGVPTASRKNQVRGVLVAAVAGLFATGLGVTLLDRRLAAPPRRRERPLPPTDDDPGTDPVPDHVPDDLIDDELIPADLTRAELTRAELTRADLTRAEPTRAEPTRAEPTRAEPTGKNREPVRGAFANGILGAAARPLPGRPRRPVIALPRRVQRG